MALSISMRFCAVRASSGSSVQASSRACLATARRFLNEAKPLAETSRANATGAGFPPILEPEIAAMLES